MSNADNRYRTDLRELRFVLFEQFKLGEILGQGQFKDWGEEEVLAVLKETARLATEVYGPLNASGDREGCKVIDGQVHEIKTAQHNRATDLIEDFMVAANETMAELMRAARRSCIRRAFLRPGVGRGIHRARQARGGEDHQRAFF